MTQPTDVARVREGARLANAMPYIGDKLLKMKETAERQALDKLRQDKLTPELALQAWQEIAAITKLLRQLKSEVSIAEDAGQRIAPAMAR
jgi:hypothetical protein